MTIDDEVIVIVPNGKHARCRLKVSDTRCQPVTVAGSCSTLLQLFYGELGTVDSIHMPAECGKP